MEPIVYKDSKHFVDMGLKIFSGFIYCAKFHGNNSWFLHGGSEIFSGIDIFPGEADLVWSLKSLSILYFNRK